MKIDNNNFRRVAAVVIKYNQHCNGRSIDDIVKKMTSDCYSFSGTWMATGGYMLTRYTSPTGEIAIRASISESIFDVD